MLNTVSGKGGRAAAFAVEITYVEMDGRIDNRVQIGHQ
jgi:hypothetical protein